MKKIKTFEDFNKVNERGITNQVVVDELKAEIEEAKKSGNKEKVDKLKNELFALTDGTGAARKVNELSTNLSNRAALISGDKKFDNDDRIGATKNNRQRSKLTSYVNPEFRKRLKSMGFDISKTGYDEATLVFYVPEHGNTYIYVTPSKYSMDLSPSDVDDAILAKLNRAIKLTQQELKSSIPAENEL